MNQKLLIIPLLLLFFAPLAIAADADFTFSIPEKIVYDVPFPVQLHVNSHGVSFIDYDLSVGTNNGKALFSPGVQRVDQFQLVGGLSGPQENGLYYRVRTETNGNTLATAAPSNLLTLSNVRVSGTLDCGFTFILRSVPQKMLTAAQSGVDFTITSQDSTVVIPQLSLCGDGVVGYVDSNQDGIKQSSENNEACDPALLGGDGCSADCRYIKSTHKIQGQTSLASKFACDFGSRDCTLQPLLAQDRLLAKLNAIFNIPADVSDQKPSCFPYVGHPDAITFENGGFCVTEKSIARQVPLLREVLLEYYEIN